MEPLNDNTIELQMPEGPPPLNPSIHYNPHADVLTIYFYGPPESVFNEPIADDMLAWLVRPDDQAIVGLEIEYFTDAFLPRHPELLEFAELAGISREKIQRIREQIGPDRQKTMLVEAILSQLKNTSSQT